MRRSFAAALVFCSVVFLGCASSTLRLPASFKPSYNSKIVTSLKTAALNGVLFQVQDSVFRDVPVRQVDRCRKTEAPTWTAQFIGLLDLMDHNPQYYNKFYIVDFKRGDHAKAEITKDIDGLTYLSLTYAKKENREKVSTLTDIPCGDSAAGLLGKDLVTTSIDWPGIDEISKVLKEAGERPKIERFQFNTDFLVYLAERQTVLKINPEVAFERTFQGDYFLAGWLEKKAQELKTPADLDFINYWLKEISSRSNQAKSIQFLGLHSETRVSYGVQVDSVGKFNRRINNYQEPTYIFMSYREKNGDYLSSNLKDLNKCLQTLLGSYRSMGVGFDSDGDSFLAPGYSCKMAGED
jgi:hypothetical protein